MTRRALKWFVFAMLVMTVPVLFFLFSVAGFFPVVGIIAICAAGKDLALAAFGIVHVAVYGALFYGIAFAVSKLCGRMSERIRLGLAAIIGIALVWVTFQPWYGWGGDGTSRFYSLYFLLHDAMAR
jgi:hypothetical protein